MAVHDRELEMPYFLADGQNSTPAAGREIVETAEVDAADH